MTGRLDQALAERGLARSRTHGARLISEGRVLVDGATATKSSLKVSDAADVRLEEPDRYVSRAAHKLNAALDAFGVDPAGRVALDMGASTGGFTQVLRERGARIVLAVDVGHGQMADEIAADPGVRVVEGFNVRFMTPEALVQRTGVTEAPSLVTGDLSFISLHHVLEQVAEVATSDADIVLLIKPQFEVGRQSVRGGIVEDAALRAEAVRDVLGAAYAQGLGTLGVAPSPIQGTHGNVEVVVHLAPGRGTGPTEWDEDIVRCTADAQKARGGR